MKHLRKYGNVPFSIVVIHGGPGALGEMAPVAKELSLDFGVLEPFQTKLTVKGQLQELRAILEKDGNLPVILIGYSWGAMLSFIFTAKNPTLVKKLILVSSGVFEDKYAADIVRTRLSRLKEKERITLDALSKTLKQPNSNQKNKIFAQLGELISKADSYNPLPGKDEVIEYRYDIYEDVWSDAKRMRSSGELVALGKQIQCRVVAIHGDYDPHPPEGIKTPLSRVIGNFRFILLKNCGHRPWMEREAKDEFYQILKKELH